MGGRRRALERVSEERSVFAAVADPRRRAILEFLATGPRPAGEIVSRFSELSQPGVSRHLRTLREARLVTVTAKAQQRIYALRPDGFRELYNWVSKYQSFWAERLDALEGHLEGKVLPERGEVRGR